MTHADIVGGWWTLTLLAVLAVAILLAFVRLLRGPTLPDRVVAFDVVSILSIGFTCAAAIAYDEPTLLDVAIILGVIAFLATVALAALVIDRGETEGEPE